MDVVFSFDPCTDLLHSRCTAEFCMICGAKWKTCNCPWFNYEQVDNDRINHFNVLINRVQADEPRYDPRGYQEEVERRRRQEQQDELLARRLQAQALNIDLDRDAYLGGHGGIVDNGIAHNPWVGHDYGAAEEQEVIHGNPYHRAGRVNDQTDAVRGLEAGVRHETSEDRRRASRAPARHLAAEEQAAGGPETHLRQPYGSWADAPVWDRPDPRRTYAGYVAEYAVHAPPQERLNRTTSRSKRPIRETRRLSTLAGLTRGHGQGGRVGAWLQHVEDGLPNEEVRNEEIAVVM